MWDLDCEESWVPKNWCFWTVMLGKTPESPLDCKKIQSVYSKGDQSWVFFLRTDAKAETPVLWPPHVKSWLIGKTLILGGIGGRRRRGWQRIRWLGRISDSMEMSFVNSGYWWWTGRPPGMLRFMGHKESDRTEWLNWAELNWCFLWRNVCLGFFPTFYFILFFFSGFQLRELPLYFGN